MLRSTRQMFHPYPYTAPVLSCSSNRLQLPLHSAHCPQYHSNLQIVGLYPLIHFIHFSHLFSLAVAAKNGRLSMLGNKKRGKVSDARKSRAHGGGCQINFRQIIKRLMFYINKTLFYYTQKCELIIYCSR